MPTTAEIAHRRARLAGVGAAVLLLALAGCKTPPACDRGSVSHTVEARFGQSVGPKARPDQVVVPDGLDRGRLVDEELSVSLALYNNAALREALVELDLTRADLVQAGLLPNPEFVYYWPAVDKPFKYLVDFPLEAVWLRPIRLKAAAAENERACGRLTQLALDLIRDTRQAYADLRLAHDQVRVAERAVAVRERVVELVEIRLKAGDASPLDAATARNDANLARQALIRAGFDVTAAQERLRNLTGLSQTTCPLVPENEVFDPRTELPVDELVTEAVTTRPDAAAADSAAKAAAERLRIAKLGWVRFLGLLDATSGRVTGHEFGPALRMTVPVFNRNQGGIGRAEAELEQLDRRRQTVRNLIVQEVRTAYARYHQARAELDYLRGKTRPEVEKATRAAATAYEEGNVTFLIVLEVQRQLIETYAREAALYAELRRAWAELERSVGRKLSNPPGGPHP